MPQLKPLSRAGIPAALAKADRYRLLGEPAEAESICCDILELDGDHQEAFCMLVLALTDQFAVEIGKAERATEVWDRLTSPYDRAYYGGIICERRAKVLLERGDVGSMRAAQAALTEALACYGRAEPLASPLNDDVILRWNATVRMLERLPDLPAEEDDRQLLMLE